MLIAKIVDGSIERVADYREWFGSPPSDAELIENSFMKVNVFKPFDRLTQFLAPCEPYIDGEFVTTVSVASMTDDQIAEQKSSALQNIRAQRNDLLQSCDYTQLQDYAGSNQAGWAQYRTLLRDLPQRIESEGIDPRTFSDWPLNPDQTS